MSLLVITPDTDANTVLLRTNDYGEISEELRKLGVRFERWATAAKLDPSAGQEEIITAYRADIDRLMATEGYQSVDVVRLYPDAADPEGFAQRAAAAREKFLAEHAHAENEVRFFVEGAGQFYLHVAERVFMVRCERGDLISVPAGATHWFDMGTKPYFAAIRLFTNPDGWHAKFTESGIAARFPTYDELAASDGFVNTPR
jgi:1,2-dihydroxy-3-keto-5-methylthiopentene dioxygenase